MDYSVQQSINWFFPYPISSESPLFIFLPGMDGSGQLYHRQVEKLSQYFDLRCLTIPSSDQSDWDTLVDQLIRLIEKELEKKASPAYLCGESFGGCLALKMAIKAPHLLQRLILVNPASSFNQHPLLSWGIELTRWIPDFLYSPSALVLLPFIAALNKMYAEDRQALLKAMQSVSQAIVSWRLSLLQNFKVESAALSRLTFPVLLLAGQRDRLLPSVLEGKNLLSHLPNAQMVILPESGHTCLLESDIHLIDILQAYNFLPQKQPEKVIEGVHDG